MPLPFAHLGGARRPGARLPFSAPLSPVSPQRLAAAGSTEFADMADAEASTIANQQRSQKMAFDMEQDVRNERQQRRNTRIKQEQDAAERLASIDVAKAEFGLATAPQTITDSERNRLEEDFTKTRSQIQAEAAAALAADTLADPVANETEGGFLGFGAEPTAAALEKQQAAERFQDPANLTDADLETYRAKNPASFAKFDELRTKLDTDQKARDSRSKAEFGVALAKARKSGFDPLAGMQPDEDPVAALDRVQGEVETMQPRIAELQAKARSGLPLGEMQPLLEELGTLQTDFTRKTQFLETGRAAIDAQRRAAQVSEQATRENAVKAPTIPQISPETAKSAALTLPDGSYETTQPENLAALVKDGAKVFWKQDGAASTATPETRAAKIAEAAQTITEVKTAAQETAAKAAAERDRLQGLVNKGTMTPEAANAALDALVAADLDNAESSAAIANRKLDSSIQDFMDGQIDAGTLDSILHAAGSPSTAAEVVADATQQRKIENEHVTALKTKIEGDPNDPLLSGESLKLAKKIKDIEDPGFLKKWGGWLKGTPALAALGGIVDTIGAVDWLMDPSLWGKAEAEKASILKSRLADMRQQSKDMLAKELTGRGVDLADQPRLIARAQLEAERDSGILEVAASRGGVAQAVGEKLPFVGALLEADRLLPFAETAYKLQSGTEVDADEMEAFTEFIRFAGNDQAFFTKVTDTVASLPGYVIELVATSGIASAVRVGGTKLLKEALIAAATKEGKERLVKASAEAVAKKFGKDHAKKYAAWRIGSGLAQEAVRLPIASGTRIAAGFNRDAAMDGVQLSAGEQGIVAMMDREGRKGNWERFAASTVDSLIENVSERSGAYIAKLVPKAARDAIGKMSQQVKGSILSAALVKSLVAANPGKPVGQIGKFLKGANIGGTFEEMGEERVGALLRDIYTGATTGEWELTLPSAEDLAVELVAFSVPNAARGVQTNMHFRKLDNSLRASDSEFTARLDSFSQSPEIEAARITEKIGTPVEADDLANATALVGNFEESDAVKAVDRLSIDLMERSEKAMATGDLEKASRLRQRALQVNRSKGDLLDGEVIRAVGASKEIAGLRDAAMQTRAQVEALPDADPNKKQAIAQVEKMEREADLAGALVKIAQGREGVLTAAEQESLKPVKGTKPAVVQENGAYIITDSGIATLRNVAPTAATFIKDSETDRRQKLLSQSTAAAQQTPPASSQAAGAPVVGGSSPQAGAAPTASSGAGVAEGAATAPPAVAAPATFQSVPAGQGTVSVDPDGSIRVRWKNNDVDTAALIQEATAKGLIPTISGTSGTGANTTSEMVFAQSGSPTSTTVPSQTQSGKSQPAKQPKESESSSTSPTSSKPATSPAADKPKTAREWRNDTRKRLVDKIRDPKTKAKVSRVVDAVGDALEKRGNPPPGGIVTTEQKGGSGVSYNPTTKAIEVNVRLLTSQVNDEKAGALDDAKLADWMDRIASEEMTHFATVEAISFEEAAAAWRKLGKSKAGKQLQSDSMRAYNAAYEQAGKQAPALDDAAAYYELIRMAIQNTEFRQRITEASFAEPGIKADLLAFLQRIADILTQRIAALPKAARAALEGDLAKVKASMDALGIVTDSGKQAPAEVVVGQQPSTDTGTPAADPGTAAAGTSNIKGDSNLTLVKLRDGRLVRIRTKELNEGKGEIVRAFTPEGKPIKGDAGAIPRSQIVTDTVPAPVDVAANEAATSPANDKPEPTDAQKKAGNYEMGHVKIGGMDITIENPAGSVRSGTDKDGEKWEVTMKSHYGYLKGTKGKDGDHIDIFIEEGTPEDFSGPVYVVNQINQDGEFDEHKAVMGPSINTADKARAAYLANYSPGWHGDGSIAYFPNVDLFKKWASASQRRAPAKTPIMSDKKADTETVNPAPSSTPAPESTGVADAPKVDTPPATNADTEAFIDRETVKYSEFHQARVREDHRKRMQQAGRTETQTDRDILERSLAEWSVDRIRPRVAGFVAEIDGKDVGSLVTKNNGMWPSFWKLFEARTGRKLPKTQKGIEVAIRAHVGESAYNEYKERVAKAQKDKDDADAVARRARILEGARREAAAIKIAGGEFTDGADFAEKSLRDGWRVRRIGTGAVPQYKLGNSEGKFYKTGKNWKPIIDYARLLQEDMPETAEETTPPVSISETAESATQPNLSPTGETQAPAFNPFDRGDRVTWESEGKTLTGTIRSVSSDGTADINTDQIALVRGVPIKRIETVSVRRLSRIPETAENDTPPPAGASKPAVSEAEQKAADAMRENLKGLFAAPRPVASPFFSQLAETVRAKMPASATPEMVRGIITNPQNRIKQEELKWSGVLPWLDQQGGKVSRDRLLTFLENEGAVELEEVSTDDYREGMIRMETEGVPFAKTKGKPAELLDAMYDSPEREREILDAIDNGQTSGDGWSVDWKREASGGYAQYQLLGGDNYREVVLAMPKVGSLKVYDTANGRTIRDGFETFTEAQTYIRENALTGVNIEPIPAQNYTSTHFPNVPNYVAHMRLNERTDATGAPGLFVEELQSDRHQAGREKGYKEDELTHDQVVQSRIVQMPETAGQYAGQWAFKNNEGRYENIRETKELAIEANSRSLYAARKSAGSVPDAPFRKDWPLALFKRALRDAVATGKDWIGWTTGETQAERYDLSKQVDSIGWHKNNGKISWTAYKDDKSVTSGRDQDEQTISEYLGKEIAAKIFKAAESDNAGALEAQDLKVGGEGMKGFYDTILPKEIAKYVKQWGATVEKRDIGANGNVMAVEVVPVSSGFGVKMADGTVKDGWPRKESAEQYMAGWNTELAKTPNTPIWRVSITPAMREGVQRGQPLFSAPRPAAEWRDEDIPEDRIPGIMQTTKLVIDAGVRTPEDFAAFMERTFPGGGSRPFVSGIWQIMGGMRKELRTATIPDWAGIYAGIDGTAEMSDASPEDQPNDATQQPGDSGASDSIGSEESAGNSTGQSDLQDVRGGVGSEEGTGTGATGQPDGGGRGDGERGSTPGSGTTADGSTDQPGEAGADSGSGIPAGGETGSDDVRKLTRPTEGTPEANFVIGDDFSLPSGPKARIDANLRAIRLLREIEKEERDATTEEKAILAKYSGWGSFKNAFNQTNQTRWERIQQRISAAGYGQRIAIENTEEYRELSAWRSRWGELHDQLNELLEPEEFRAMSKSILNAHYTSLPIIDSMWKIVERLGFKGGKVLETSAGGGYFVGRQPKRLADKSEWNAVELDEITSRIFSKLYPEARINGEPPKGSRRVNGLGFQQSSIPNNSIDLVIGNFPFDDLGPNEATKEFGMKMNLHNYFFARSLDKIRPGGLVVAITSASTMDNNLVQRELLAGRAELVAAIRLPNTAFKDSAGTEVTTDIIILRKKDGSRDVGGEAWLHTAPVGTDVVTVKASGKDSYDYLSSIPAGWVPVIESLREPWAAWRAGRPRTGEKWKNIITALRESGFNAQEGIRFTAPIEVNQYFENHPEMVMGRHSLAGTMYSAGEYAVTPDGSNLLERIDEAISNLPENVLGENVESELEKYTAVEAQRGDREGSTIMRDGKVYQVIKRQLVPVRWDVDILEGIIDGHSMMKGNKALRAEFNAASSEMTAEELDKYLRKLMAEKLTASAIADIDKKIASEVAKRTTVFASWVKVRDAARSLVNAELDDLSDEKTEALREKLNEVYDAHVAKFGAFGKRGQNPHRFLDDDEDTPLLDSLEDEELVSTDAKGKPVYRYVKRPIFFKAQLSKTTAPESAESIEDAIGISIGYLGRLSVPYMAKLLGTTETEAVTMLNESGLALVNPKTGLYETADMYLSGEVRAKLREAEKANLESGGQYTRNVELLKAVLPANRPIQSISVNMGARWVPGEVYTKFAREILGLSQMTISYQPAANIWRIEEGGSSKKVKNTNQSATTEESFETDKVSVGEIIDAVLNKRQIAVYDMVGRNQRVFNSEATVEAKAKADQMAEKFNEWVKSSDSTVEVEGEEIRVGDLAERLYNENVAGVIPPNFKGDWVTLPGQSGEIWLKPHRRAVLARMLTLGYGMMAHGVGSGKTYNQIALAMELRRLGKARKVMTLVQNSTIKQFAASHMKAYPQSRILVADEKNFTARKRAKFQARIATGDYDSIILTHSNVALIGHDEQAIRNYMARAFDQLTAALADAEDGSTEQKDIQKAMDKLQEKLDKMLKEATSRAGGLLTWEQLGIDALIVDEAHAFKNAPIVTRMARVKNLPNGDGSAQAIMMQMKVSNVQATTGGKNIFFATGTPITNTMAEAYTMLNFIAPSLLEQRGIRNFDDFATTFGRTVSEPEATWKGEIENVERFAKFINGPELVNLIRSVFDVALGNESMGIRVPRIKGGKPKAILIEPTEASEIFNDWIIDTAAAFARIPNKRKAFEAEPWLSAIPIMTMQAGMAQAIDPRLINPNVPDDPESKVNKAVEEVVRIYKQGEKNRTAQVIFSDLSNPFSTMLLRQFNGDPFEEYGSVDSEMESLEAQIMAFQGMKDLPEADEREKKRLVKRYSDLVSQQFNLFEDIKAKLIAKGIPAAEIAIASSDMDRKKLQASFEKVNSGQIRVIMGSTARLGVGVNIQERLAGCHNISPPRDFKPAMMEQRIGRIERQGNLHRDWADTAFIQTVEKYAKTSFEGKNLEARYNAAVKWLDENDDNSGRDVRIRDLAEEAASEFDVEVINYGLKLSMDSAVYSMMNAKQGFIEQVLMGENVLDEFDDPASEEAAGFALMAAEAMGNEDLKTKVVLDGELRKIRAVRVGYLRDQWNRKSSLETTRRRIEQYLKKDPAAIRAAGADFEGAFERVKKERKTTRGTKVKMELGVGAWQALTEEERAEKITEFDDVPVYRFGDEEIDMAKADSKIIEPLNKFLIALHQRAKDEGRGVEQDIFVNGARFIVSSTHAKGFTNATIRVRTPHYFTGGDSIYGYVSTFTGNPGSSFLQRLRELATPGTTERYASSIESQIRLDRKTAEELEKVIANQKPFPQEQEFIEKATTLLAVEARLRAADTNPRNHRYYRAVKRVAGEANADAILGLAGGGAIPTMPQSTWDKLYIRLRIARRGDAAKTPEGITKFIRDAVMGDVADASNGAVSDDTSAFGDFIDDQEGRGPIMSAPRLGIDDPDFIEALDFLNEQLPSETEREDLLNRAGFNWNRTFTDDELRQAASGVRVGLRSEYDERRDRQTHEGWNAEAVEMLRNNRQGVIRDLVATAAAGEAIINPVQVKASQLLLPSLTMRALAAGDRQAMRDAEALTWAYDIAGTETARGLAARWQPHKTPEELHRELIAKAIFTPSKADRDRAAKAPTPSGKRRRIAELEAEIERVKAEAIASERNILQQASDMLNQANRSANTMTAEMRKELNRIRRETTQELKTLREQLQNLQDQKDSLQILAEANDKRLKQIEEAFKEMGVTFHDLFISKEAVVALRTSSMVKNVLGQFNEKERLVTKMRMEAKTDRHIAKKLNISKTAVEAINERFNVAFRAQAREWVKRGFSAADLDGSVDIATLIDEKGNLLSSARPTLTDAEIDAKVDEIFRVIVPSEEARATGALKRVPSGPKEGEFGFDLSRPEHAAMLMQAIQRLDATGMDMVYEYWINGLLSGPATHMANLAGNAGNAAWEYSVQRPVEMLVNSIVTRDAAGAQFDEIKSMAKYLGLAASTAIRYARIVWNTEVSLFDPQWLNKPVSIGTTSGDKGQVQRFAIKGGKGRAIRLPSRALLFADEFAKHLFGMLEAAAQAHRLAKAEGLKGAEFDARVDRLVKTPGSPAWIAAVDKAHAITFTSELPAPLQKMQDALHDRAKTPWGAVIKTFLRFLFPFVRTPYNIFATGLRKTPLGGLRMIGKGIAAYRGNEPFFDSYPKAAMAADIAEQLLAWTATMMLIGIAEGDPDDDEKTLLITGSRSLADNRGEDQMLSRMKGGENTIVWKGKPIFHYGRYEPFSTVITTVVDAARNMKAMGQGRSTKEAFDQTWRGFLNQARSKTFLQGLEGLMSLIEGHKNLTDSAVKAVAQGVVPNLIRQPVRAVDDFARDSRNAPWYYHAFPAGGLAEPLYDLYGRPIEKAGSPVTRALVSVPTKQAPIVPADRAMSRFNLENPNDAYYPQQPNKSMFRYKVPVPGLDAKGRPKFEYKDMTPQQAAAFRKRAGQQFAAEATMTFPFGAGTATPLQMEDIKSKRDRVQRETKETMFPGRSPAMPPRKAPTLAELFGQRLRQ